MTGKPFGFFQQGPIPFRRCGGEAAGKTSPNVCLKKEDEMATEKTRSSEKEGSRGETTSSRPYLLDTSALLALIQDEPGADQVEKALRQRSTFLPWPVLLETYYITLREEGASEAEHRLALMKRLNVNILWDIDEQTMLIAGQFKAAHRVSLADAIIAAYAVTKNAVLMHKDPEFEALKGLLSMETLPYKTVLPKTGG